MMAHSTQYSLRRAVAFWMNGLVLQHLLILGLCALIPVTSTAKTVRASADPVKDEEPITAEEREHWSFKPLIKPALPAVKNTSGALNEIDHFILSKIEARGLAPAPVADPLTFIRRVTFDLTGLPPTPQEVQTFVQACGWVVQDDDSKWVKDGDGLATRSPEAIEAAYAALVDRLLQSPRYGERWAQHWLDLARFAETDGYERDIERKEAWKYRDWVIRALNADLPYDEFVALQIAGDELPNGEAVATGFLFAGPDMPETNFQDERLHLLLNDITNTVGTTFLGLTVGCAQCHDHPYDPISQADFYRLRAFFDNLPRLKKDIQLGVSMHEAGDKAPPSRVAIRGDHQRPGPVVQAAFLRIANRAEMVPNTVALKSSTGRRTALARWITQPTNGLFLRTAMNHVWQHHFGKPIVGTPDDLGRKGQTPSNPELLDWLAAELPQRRWSMKSMHRLIVLSNAYRQAVLPANDEASGEVWRGFERRRLSGEELRDAMLSAAGRLAPETGGPGVRLPLPPELQLPGSKKPASASTFDPALDRRSIYVFAQRNLHHPLFDLFDRPDAMISCSRRSETTTAPQALTLFNSEFSLEMAQALAALVLKQGSDSDTIINEATWRCFSRAPTKKELQLGRAFLDKHKSLTPTLIEAVTDYCLALMNASAFCYLD
jgi:hypothetical protein